MKRLLKLLAGNFFAGEDKQDALIHSRMIQDKYGLNSVINKFGEHYEENSLCEYDKEKYIEICETINEHNLKEFVGISVKPTQLGLDINEGTFMNNFNDIINSSYGVKVSLDMERYEHIDPTIKAFKQNCTENEMAICLQAYLKRTKDDLKDLSEVRGKVRMVKGAYNEKEEVAYQSKKKIDEQYKKNIDYMLSDKFNPKVAVATHDKEIIDYVKEKDPNKKDFEFQMLMGIRSELQRDLVREGYTVRRYIPYGEKWVPYFYRRVQEKPSYMITGLKNLY